MNVQQLIRELSAREIRLTVEDGKLRAHAPKGAMTPQLSQAIAANKDVLLRSLSKLAQQRSKTPIQKADRSKPLPLSAPQRRMWFLDALEGNSATYNIAAALRMEGQLSEEAVAAALSGIVQRHEALRTRFPAVEGEPSQVIDADSELALQRLDLSALPNPETGLKKTLEREAARSFDLAADRLLRAVLVKLADDDHVLLLTMHHIVADGWSIGVLVKEFGELYRAACEHRPSPLAELPVQVADVAAWQNEQQNEADRDEQREYWRGQLADLPPLLELPTDHPRPPVQSFRGDSVMFQVDQALHQRLQAFVQQHDATLFMGLITAFSVLLERLSRRDDVVMGSPVANRQQEELEALIGFFVNTLALRVPVKEHWTFLEVLQAVRQHTLAAYQNQDVPFEDLVDMLRPERSLAYAPIFQVMFALQNAPGSGLSLPDLQLSPVAVDTHTAKFDLNVSMHETPDGLQGQMEYATDLFERPTVERMARQYTDLLELMTAEPQRCIADVPLLAAPEQPAVLAFSQPSVVARPFQPLARYVEQAAQQWPDAVALVAGPVTLTYDQLNRQANQLAVYLRSLKVRPDEPVGVRLPRGADLFIALLAILKAGAAYLPLDPEYPDERLAYMIDDARCRMVVALDRREMVGAGIQTREIKQICLDRGLLHQLRYLRDDDRDIAVGPEHLGYVIYTSGSTGKPKGVAMRQGALANLLDWQAAALPLAAGTPVLQFASVNFDVSFQETFSTWAAGGQLIVADADRRRDADALLALLVEQQIQRAFLPVVMLQHLAQAARRSAAAPTALRDVITAGEALTITDDVRWLFQQLPDAHLHNHYGPSETHVVTAWTLPPQPQDWPAVASIGAPIDNCSIYIVAPGDQLCPVGVPGELLIGGAGLARGYLRRPDLTAERFVPDPWSSEPGAKLYRSGDLARWRPDGSLELIGRVDHQVKVRGFRVELGEVEANLGQHPALRNVAVVVRGSGSEKRLVAYYAALQPPAPPIAELRAHLERLLPAWMIPTQWLELPELPLTLSGKIDRLRLPEPGRLAQAPAEPPATPLEAALLPLWRDLLGRPDLGVTEDFFAVGGHSLIAARLANRIRSELQRDCPLRLLFEHSTVRDLARALSGAAPAAGQIPAQPRGGLLPCSSQQRRLWFQARLTGPSGDYNMPGAVRLTGPLDVAAVRRALNALVARHEPLRTRLVAHDDNPWQEILPPQPLPLDVQTVIPLALPAALDGEANTPFALDQAPLLRARLFRLNDADHVLAFTVHHAMADGWSIGLLTQEFAALYTAALRQPTTADGSLPISAGLAPLAVQYADYAAWQNAQRNSNRLARQRARWRELLGDLPPLLPLPTDYPRPLVAGNAGGMLPVVVPGPRLAALRRLAEQHHVTLFVLLLAAWQAWLARLTGEKVFAVGTAHAHRDRPELEPLVGYFAELCALPARLPAAGRVADWLAQTRATVLETSQLLDVPFEQVVEELAPRRDPGHTPIFQCMFLLHNLPDTGASLDGLTATPLPPAGDTAKHDLSLHLWESADRLTGHLEYRLDLFHPDTISLWRNDFMRWLQRWCSEDNAQIFDAAPPAPRLLRLEAGEGLRQWLGQQAEPNSVLVTALADAGNPLSLDAAGAVLSGQHGRAIAVTARSVEGEATLLAADTGSGAVDLPRLAVRQLPVRRLPLTPGGRLDDAALAALPRLDAAWAAALEQRLAGLPGVTAAAVLELPLAEPQPLHLSDLLPNRPLLAVDSAVAAALASPTLDHPASAAPSTQPPAYADGGALTLPDDYPRTLGAALRRTAERWPERGIRILAAQGEAFLSYADLLLRARQRLAALQAAGLQPGHYVILQMPDLLEYFPTFWACVLGGIAPVTVAVPAQYDPEHAVTKKLLHTWRTLEQPTLLAGDVQAAGLQALDGNLQVLPLAQIQALTQAGLWGIEHPAQPSDRVFFQLSAGSTGLSKAITETHAGVLQHVYAGALACDVGPADVSVNWLPMDHVVPLLTWHIRDTVLGIPQYEIPTDRVLADPLLWLEVIDRYRGTLTWAPNFGFRLVADALSRRQDRSFDLRSMRWFMNAGEQVTRPVLQAFFAGTAPFGVTPAMFQPAFGMAEVCTCMTYNNDYSPETRVHRIRKTSLGGHLLDAPAGDLDAVEFVDLGPPVPGVEIRIADAAHQTLPERSIGRLQIRGGVVTPGYYRNDAANAEAFVGEGWFNTGDLGFMAGGRLALTGREKEMIIVHGANFYCHEIEDAVNTVPGVLPTYSAAVGVAEQQAGTEALVVFCVPDGSRAETELVAAVREHITRGLGVAPAYVVPLAKAEFPKTTSGKIQRAQLKNGLLAGSFDAVLKALDIAARNEHTLPPCWHQRIWRPAQPWPRVDTPQVLLLDDGDSDLARPLAKLLGSRCLGSLAGNTPIPDHVTDLVWLNAWSPNVQTLDNELAAAAYAPLLDLLARLPQRPLRLTVAVTQLAATAADVPISSRWGALPGLLATAQQEQPHLTAVLVDLPAAGWRSHAEWLVSELHSHAGERHVVWRLPDPDPAAVGTASAQRLVERLLPVTPAPQQALPFRRGGRYLLTGGLGGLGRLLAGWLLEHYGAHLLLLVRHPPLDHPAWRDLQHTAQRSGGRLDYVVGDLAEPAAWIDEALPAALQQMGGCDGLLHLAGSYAEKPLTDLAPADLQQAVAAKVIGLWLLEACLPKDAWVLAFSSVLGWFGARHAASYAAANSWLDSLATDLRRRRTVYTPAFSNWRGLGMSAGYVGQAASEARGYRFLEADAGIHALLAALAADWPAPLIGLDDQRPAVARHLERGPLAVSRWAAYLEAVEAPALPALSDADGRPLTLDWQHLSQLPRTADGAIDRAALIARGGRQVGGAPASALEQQLADLWTEVLGHPPPGRDARFFEHGGNSIAAIAFVARIGRALGRDVPVATLFRAQTLAELAAELAVAAPVSTGCLVELNPGPLEHTVVLCHPGGGNVLCYRDLAATLAPRRVLGLQAPAWNGGPLPADWPDLVDTYAAALAEALPAGTACTLAGWSFGGLVAFALACRLQHSHPLRLTILDVTADLNPTDRERASHSSELDTVFAAFPDLEPQRTAISALPGPQQLPAVLGQLHQIGALPAGFDLEQASRFLAMAKRFVELRLHGLPQDWHYNGTAHILSSRETRDRGYDADLGWAGRVGQVTTEQAVEQHLDFVGAGWRWDSDAG